MTTTNTAHRPTAICTSLFQAQIISPPHNATLIAYESVSTSRTIWLDGRPEIDAATGGCGLFVSSDIAFTFIENFATPSEHPPTNALKHREDALPRSPSASRRDCRLERWRGQRPLWRDIGSCLHGNRSAHYSRIEGAFGVPIRKCRPQSQRRVAPKDAASCQDGTSAATMFSEKEDMA